jgi:broad specificity phosphatase PhoE
MRHDETNDNRDRIAPTPSTPLSALGQQQAQQLVQRLQNIAITKIISSDYRRTQ